MSKKAKVKKLKLGKLEKREARYGYLFILPWFIGVLVFLLIPLVQSFQFSLADIRMTPFGRLITFVGHENYTQIWLEDKDFPVMLVSYFVETLLSVPIIVVFALIIAMLLNGRIKFKGTFRLIFFLPVIIVSGPVMLMLTGQGATSISTMNVQAISSALNQFLPTYIAKSISEVFGNMVTILWYSGVQILIFISALQKIDPSLYEAAKMDGGSEWECFWKITLPTIKPMILLNAVYTVIAISNNESNSIISIIQSAMFAGNKGYGYASAMAWMYSLAETLIIGIVALVLVTKRDAYDKQVKKIKKDIRKQNRAIKRARRRGRRNDGKIKKALSSKQENQ